MLSYTAKIWFSFAKLNSKKLVNKSLLSARNFTYKKLIICYCSSNVSLARDFTYIDDIVQGIITALDSRPSLHCNSVLNLGCGRPIKLVDMIKILESELGTKAKLVSIGFVAISYYDSE